MTGRCVRWRPAGDPIYPGRGKTTRTMAMDKGHYMNCHAHSMPGGMEYADDVVFMYLQGTTQYDALGHVWYDDQLYNGYDAKTTIGGLQKCSVEKIGDRGVVGRGILLDVARYKGVKHLQANEASRSTISSRPPQPRNAPSKSTTSC